MKRPGIRFVAMATAVALTGCGGSPSQPSLASPQGTVGAAASGGSARSMNAPPSILWKTTPRPDMDTLPYPTVSGVAPLTVRFNLCGSRDPEQVTLPDGTFDPAGDFINWQFHFGESGEPAFREDGTFNSDFDHFCRVEHVYGSPGSYVATLNVTDRHVSDEAGDVAALAQVSARVTIEVLPEGSNVGAPDVLSFRATSGCGEPTFTWRTANATGVTLDGGIGSFGPNGSVTSDVPDGTVVTLTAAGPGGTERARVTVDRRCEAI